MEKNSHLESEYLLIMELLKSKSLSNRALGKALFNLSKKESFSPKYWKERRTILNKCYKLFLNSISPDDVRKITLFDSKLKELINKVEEKSGWRIYPNEAILETNFRNQESLEDADNDTFKLERKEDGYHVPTHDFKNQYYRYVEEKEEEFLKKYEEELSLIHNAFTEKEKIMNERDFTIANDSIDPNLVEYLVEYISSNTYYIKDTALDNKMAR